MKFCPLILTMFGYTIFAGNGFVRKCVKLSPFSYTIFILDLALNYIDKL